MIKTTKSKSYQTVVLNLNGPKKDYMYNLFDYLEKFLTAFEKYLKYRDRNIKRKGRNHLLYQNIIKESLRLIVGLVN